MAPPRRPTPGSPPASYALVDGQALFYRRVGEREYAAWKANHALLAEPGGMALGKHVSTTAELARTWGVRFVEWGHETSVGRVLRISLPADIAETVDFVGPNTDGIGPCYFIVFEQLTSATIMEVTP